MASARFVCSLTFVLLCKTVMPTARTRFLLPPVSKQTVEASLCCWLVTALLLETRRLGCCVKVERHER